MSTELGSLLARAVEELSPTDGLDASRMSRVVRSVRRRRLRRHTVESAVGVAAAGVVGTAVWAGLQLTPPPPQPAAPSVTSTPTVRPSPTVDPSPSTPTPSPSPTPTSPSVPASFGQPPSTPVTDAILTSATEGWSLALDLPAYRVAGGTDEIVGTEALYLLSPTGDRYKLLDLPENPPVAVNQLTYWKAGEPRALVSTSTQAGVPGYAWLDLRTGELTSASAPPGWTAWIGVSATGSMVWEAMTDRTYSVVAPDGTTTSQTPIAAVTERMAATMDPTRTYLLGDAGLLNLVTGRLQPMIGAGMNLRECQVVGWSGDTEPILNCAGGGSPALRHAVLVLPSASISYGEPVFADPGLASDDGIETLPDGRLGCTMTVDGVFGVFAVASDGTATLVQDMGQETDRGTVKVTVVGGTVFVSSGGIVVAHDLASGRSYDLNTMPTVSGAPYGIGPVTWTGGPRWWVMGTSW
ncbi:hypothetical protein ACPPVS_18970 [Cellulomonas sp. McL0617]|uniref:hypothetical protein n=1 Tax=Cellulomonas sp. McL0617 TaxID=3415675 RepID=UPI003CEF9EA4